MSICHNNKGTLTIKYYTHSSELPAVWDELVPAHHFLHRSQLVVTESAGLPDLSFIYILLTNNNKAIFAAGFQLLSLTKEHVNSEMVKPLQYAAWQLYTGILRPKLLVGGHLFRHDVSSVYCDSTLAPYEAYTCYNQAIEKAMNVSCASAVLIKDMPPHLATYFRNYEPEYMMLRNDISMEMGIPAKWQDIHDYEAALKHKYAQRFRKIRQTWAGLDIHELNLEQVHQTKQRIFELYQLVTAHQQVRIGLLNADFIPTLKTHDDRLKVWGIYENGTMTGFFSAWVYETVFDMFYIGFDYERNKDLNLYFNILFFAVEQAIHYKKSRLILGRTALDAKARLGCMPKYLSTFLYIKNGIIRQRVAQAQKNTDEKEGEWESRHPLKGQA